MKDSPVAVVFDLFALNHYVSGPVAGLAVAELISEVGAEGRLAAVSALALTQALASHSPDRDKSFGFAQLQWFLTENSDLAVFSMTPGQVEPTSRVMQTGWVEVGFAHTILLAVTHNAQFATADPVAARSILGLDWPILDVSERPFS